MQSEELTKLTIAVYNYVLSLVSGKRCSLFWENLEECLYFLWDGHYFGYFWIYSLVVAQPIGGRIYGSGLLEGKLLLYTCKLLLVGWPALATASVTCIMWLTNAKCSRASVNMIRSNKLQASFKWGARAFSPNSGTHYPSTSVSWTLDFLDHNSKDTCSNLSIHCCYCLLAVYNCFMSYCKVPWKAPTNYRPNLSTLWEQGFQDMLHTFLQGDAFITFWWQVPSSSTVLKYPLFTGSQLTVTNGITPFTTACGL